MILKKNSISYQTNSIVQIQQKPGNYQDEYDDVFLSESTKTGLIMLGRGGFGTVSLIKNKKTGEQRALKMIKKVQSCETK